MFFLFVAFEELVKKVVRPSLQNSKVVILDRYLDSTFAYQGLAGDLEVDIIREIAEKTINIPLPDITFVLDIDPLKAQERLNKRKEETNEYSNFDALKLEFHQKVRNSYLELKKIFPERIVFINAEQKEDKILAEVQAIINQSRDKKN
jgi:dTMP kinase